MRRLLPLTCSLALLPLLVPSTADAARKRKELRDDVEDIGTQGPKANAGEIPALARLLARTGWTPTPELTGAFRPGFVFLDTDLGHRLQLEDCFTATPTTSTYTAAEVVTQLQAGVSVNLGAGSVGAGGSIVKKVKFGTPEHHSVPALKMVPTTECRIALLGARAAGADLDRMYVVQEVLTAQIAEQTCGRVDAHGNFVALGGAEVELAVACAQASLEPVAIAYRTTPVTALAGIRDSDAPGTDPSPRVEEPPRVAEKPPVEEKPPVVEERPAEPPRAQESRPLIGSTDTPLSAFAGHIGSSAQVDQWKEERAQDPDGTSIYDSLTFRREGDPEPLSDPTEVQEMISRHMLLVGVEMRGCYTDRLRAVPDLQGRWKATFTIRSDGTPRDIVLTGLDGASDAPLEGCMRSVIAGEAFQTIQTPQPVAKTWHFTK